MLSYPHMATWQKLTVLGVLVWAVFVSRLQQISYPGTHKRIINFGYGAETHTVETEDGFLIDIHRIISKKTKNGHSPPPVILQHGVVCTSDTWVLSGPESDLAFLLSDAGFDVWLTNSRGNVYTRLRQTPPPSTIFYDFSYEEFGFYDLPAVLDYVTQRTGYKKVSYVGHSIGNVIYLVAMSLRPEYLDKVNYYVGLAPFTVCQQGTICEQTLSMITKIGLTNRIIRNSYLEIMRPGNVLRHHVCAAAQSIIDSSVGNKIMDRQIGISGTKHSYFGGVCQHASGVPHFTFQHLSDNILQGRFSRRNFGPLENVKRYNSSEPPLFDLSHITTPTSFYCGEYDRILLTTASLFNASLLPNLEKIQLVKGLGHMELVWPGNASKTHFTNVVQDLLRANKVENKS